MSSRGWLALESNPETINPFITKMGVSGIECVDVFSFDDEMLQFVPKPQLALILCFPSKEAREYLKKKYEEVSGDCSDDVFFMNQSEEIGNACGTFALFHSLANLEDRISIGDGKFKKWLDKAKEVSADQRSNLLSEDADIAEAHEETAELGETDTAEQVDYHFITYVNKNSVLYEIDSCAPFPRKIGSTSDETMVKDASKAIMELMSHVNLLSFSAMALVGK